MKQQKLPTHFDELSNKTSSAPYPNITTTVKLRGRDVKIHGLCSGTVAVKTAFRTKRGNGVLSKLNILLDHSYTEFMPIWVWVIEHPDGTVMIDTGETAEAKNIDQYLARENAFSRFLSKRMSKHMTSENDELDQKLHEINVKTEDIKLVALTHLHLDHTDGIKFFPKAEIIVNEYEYKHPYSNLPTTYPKWFKPHLVNYKDNEVDVFNKAYPITTAGDLLYIPTPGHSYGHSSIIFKTDDLDIIFSGDTSYNQEQLIRKELAGVNADFKRSRETYKNLELYSRKYKTIYLPTHDAYSGTRLMNKSFLPIIKQL
jgi:N-acyl homoserine lactone hydrolase